MTIEEVQNQCQIFNDNSAMWFRVVGVGDTCQDKIMTTPSVVHGWWRWPSSLHQCGPELSGLICCTSGCIRQWYSLQSYQGKSTLPLTHCYFIIITNLWFSPDDQHNGSYIGDDWARPMIGRNAPPFLLEEDGDVS